MTIERLREIAENDFSDYEDLAKAVREIAHGLVEMKTTQASKAAATHSAPGRGNGKPVPDGCEYTECRKCGASVVVFTSKRTGKKYLCDSELGEYDNKLQMLSAPNWFHECVGAIGKR